MKKTLSLLLMLALSLGVSMARVPKKPFVTQVFKTDIHCQNCQKKIMDNVAVFGAGVQDVKVNVSTKEVTITYDPQKTNVNTLIKGFEKLNVKAVAEKGVITPVAKPETKPATSCSPGQKCTLPAPEKTKREAEKPVTEFKVKR
ncbi:MAG: cation transporter [Alloprevotella sp.]|nr:cation transporter [Alloprevotella sp.]MBR1652033.1 cation transporter [Alloprevotella sp.]MBR1653216.1 cation transporter [Alloprevotella sp.]